MTNPNSTIHRINAAGIPPARYYKVRRELIAEGVEHSVDDVIEIVKSRQQISVGERERRVEMVRDAVRVAGTQRAVERHLGVCRGLVHQWLRGKAPVPGYVLQDLSEIAEGIE